MVVMKKAGKGQVYDFGTNPTASIAARDKGGLKVVRAIVKGVLRPASLGTKLESQSRFAGLYPAFLASSTVMNLPFVVLPYQCPPL